MGCGSSIESSGWRWGGGIGIGFLGRSPRARRPSLRQRRNSGSKLRFQEGTDPSSSGSSTSYTSDTRPSDDARDRRSVMGDLYTGPTVESTGPPSFSPVLSGTGPKGGGVSELFFYFYARVSLVVASLLARPLWNRWGTTRRRGRRGVVLPSMPVLASSRALVGGSFYPFLQ